MQRPIVIGYHLIWTVYGYWLPNDPRGSTSRYIASDVIAELGELHYGRKRVQPAGWMLEDFHEKAAQVLKYSLLRFTQRDFSILADAFAETVAECRYTCYACAIMPDHVHMLIRKHKHLAEEMIVNLQESSRLRLRNEQLRTFIHPVWGGPGWKVFLDCPRDIERTIKYINSNPTKIGLPPQHWSFVKQYDGWPLHPGHDPNSPYARRLRPY